MRMTAAAVVIVFIVTIAVNYYHLRVCVSVCVHAVTVRNHGKYGCDHCCFFFFVVLFLYAIRYIINNDVKCTCCWLLFLKKGVTLAL